MRRLVLASVCCLVACVGVAPSRQASPSAEPLRREPPPVVAEALPSTSVASQATAATLEAARLVTRAVSGEAARLGTPLAPSPTGNAILRRAVELVGVKRLARISRSVPDDCSGFVRFAYSQAGIDLVRDGFLAGENAVSGIFRRAQSQGALHQHRPRPGDLVFFRETYDRNRDGLRNDGMTHIAIVERVEEDGTVTFIHRGSKGIARARMNPLLPTQRRAGLDGPVLNDVLRPAAKGHRAYLTGELFAGFASPEAL